VEAGGGRGFPLYYFCSLTTLGVYAHGGVMCLPPISSGNRHINPRFFLTFPSPQNTMVKEPFMKKIFDVCQPEDPNGGIDIFFEIFTFKLF